MLTLSPKRIVCVGYSDAFSVGGKSLIDLQLGDKTGRVASNQIVLDRAEPGDLVVVTSQCRHFTVGVLNSPVTECTVWTEAGGHAWKYAWSYTPITSIAPIKQFRSTWAAICAVHEVPDSKVNNLFNSRLCGYGEIYINALVDALSRGFITRIA